MRRIEMVALVGVLAAGRAQADPIPPREIAVSGDAEIKVVPDQVILTIAVVTQDKDLLTAKTQNDERVKRVLAVTHDFKIEQKHVQTDQITIEPRYRSYNDKQEFLGFEVRKSVVICLKDLTRFEPVLLALIKAGTNRVDGVQFQTSELRKYRDEARQKAVRAAREKAQAMAGELGQKLGRPRSIVESGAGLTAAGRGSAYQNFSGSSGGDSPGAENGFAPGQISVTASVSVRFDLAD